MKKITLLTAFLISFVGFSQANKQSIQAYLDANRAKLGLTAKDVSDWIIESEGSSKVTKITNYRLVQQYHGVEVYGAQSNVWVKEGKVINVGNGFKRDIASKINTTTPTLNVFQAAAAAYSHFGINTSAAFSISERLQNNRLLLSDGVHEDQITAKLAFQEMPDNKLKLVWALQFYTPNGKHYWDVTVDAVNGSILEQKDLTISCNFGGVNHKHAKKDFSFENVVFNSNSALPMLVNPGTYRVIPYNYASPDQHPFELITTAGDPLASPNGWHDANTTIGGTSTTLKYTYSRGNNVLAQEDADGNNGNGIRAEGGASLTFDFPYGGPTFQPTAYTSAATTNLFYMNNIMHDIWYNYGFDEVNANFQQTNIGRGGVNTALGDYVQADSQDGYSQTTQTLNNANFTPSNDGVRPRMQMFMWNAGAPPTNYLTVNSPASIAGSRAATTNVFEGTDRIPVPTAPNGITRDLVLYENAPNPNTNTISIHNACVAPSNAFDVIGKIVLIRRGNCNFSNKVKNAQDAGALAAIVYDTVPNNEVRLSMSSEGLLGITIPAVFVTKEIGDELIAAMATSTVNVKLESPADLYLYADGDFDNVIIGHEYGHGISNRLVGGGSAGCMGNAEQMGEGWSDWFGLMLQLKGGDNGATPIEVGTFVTNQGPNGVGIRDFPYSTDMGLNPRTLSSSNAPIDPLNAYKYKVGETWASILWDLTWAYIDKYGFDPDVYNGTGGNNKVMQLVIDAMKLETCNKATFITGRNNLMAAEQASTGGADYCLIADVFAKRGVGLNASSGSSDASDDQVEDFTPFPQGPNCVLSVNYFNNDELVRVYPNPSNGLLNIRINKLIGKVNFQIVDINGRVVYNQTDEHFNTEKAINISNFQKGVYILKVVGDNLNYSQKVIRN